MKPLPDLTDEVAALLKGRQTLLWAAKREAMETLRDAYTALQTAQWGEMTDALGLAELSIEQLRQICHLWEAL